MISLVLTICMTTTSCDDYTVDSFTTMKECTDTRMLFIIEKRVPATEADLLSCKELTND